MERAEAEKMFTDGLQHLIGYYEEFCEFNKDTMEAFSEDAQYKVGKICKENPEVLKCGIKEIKMSMKDETGRTATMVILLPTSDRTQQDLIKEMKAMAEKKAKEEGGILIASSYGDSSAIVSPSICDCRNCRARRGQGEYDA